MTDEDDILAAEFALGLLDPHEGDAVRQRAASDAVLSLRIAWWRDQLAPLVAEAEVAPPAHLWGKIEGRLPVNDNLNALVGRWRALAIGATGIAAALAIYIGARPPVTVFVPQPGAIQPASVPAPMVATLSGDKNPAIVNISYDAASGQMTIAPTALKAEARDAELWIIPEDGKPRSMGVIDVNAPAGHTVPADRRGMVHPGATFAISMEPKGGSPTGQPTGAVIATGKIIRV